MANILVTGGAGYIGSHTVRFLLRAHHAVSVVDDLSKGYAHNVPAGLLYRLNLADTDALAALMEQSRIDAVIHFAASIAVGESTKVPEAYFANNVGGTISLLNAMTRAGVSKLVFSSTAAVYGNPTAVPISETAAIAPVNPYGESKAIAERMFDWMDVHRGLRSVRLRYFNACGCEPEFGIGEEHEPETHLIPLILRAVESGTPVTIFGDDYSTPDGTCVRDYVHVSDLASAHIAALEWLDGGGATGAYNCGTGRGQSVREVIAAVEEVTGRKVPYKIGPRREGDPAVLVADSTRLRQALGWSPRYADLRDIVRSAWEFEKRRTTALRA